MKIIVSRSPTYITERVKGVTPFRFLSSDVSLSAELCHAAGGHLKATRQDPKGVKIVLNFGFIHNSVLNDLEKCVSADRVEQAVKWILSLVLREINNHIESNPWARTEQSSVSQLKPNQQLFSSSINCLSHFFKAKLPIIHWLQPLRCEYVLVF